MIFRHVVGLLALALRAVAIGAGEVLNFAVYLIGWDGIAALLIVVGVLWHFGLRLW